MNPDTDHSKATALNRPHPLILVASVAVTAASLAAIAHFAGWLPANTSTTVATANAPSTVTTPTPLSAAPAASETPVPPTAPVVTSAPAPGPSANPAPTKTAPPAAHKPRHARDADEDFPPVAPARPAQVQYRANEQGAYMIESAPAPVYRAPVCRDCGVVESVREIRHPAQATGLGAVTGGVIGGVVGHQIGNGHGRELATVVGAIGGAFAGNESERTLRGEREYQTTLRMDDGTLRTFSDDEAPPWRRGDRVRVGSGQITPY
ncbi:glycine zipper 2TM domain-containing protein [Rhodocyclus tenuis]|uniref:glycine zipper 2TM domain-containing protein n=1 Tax=Rhodocyclus gracilis TaxID=2929842 RepID=UPI001298CEAC|nr:glycine zipper 2TM domain-containing protein [Rhodocyclus gracilis]MRD71877.1 glycine zipper 2TM domain-containing protein [Rhodocyclus gracilis]